MGRGGETSRAIAVAASSPKGSTQPCFLMRVPPCACALICRDRSRSRSEEEEEEERRDNRKRDRSSGDEEAPRREAAEHDKDDGSEKHADDRGKRRVAHMGCMAIRPHACWATTLNPCTP